MHQETRRELERLCRERGLVEELEGDVSGMSLRCRGESGDGGGMEGINGEWEIGGS